MLRTCQGTAGQCIGRATPHHLRKDGQGGAWSLTNLVGLCVVHQRWVEDHPTDAHRLGLVIRTGETPELAWAAMRLAGLAVGRQDVACLGSGLEPLSVSHLADAARRGICSACGHPRPLEPTAGDPPMWVLVAHERPV